MSSTAAVLRIDRGRRANACRSGAGPASVASSRANLRNECDAGLMKRCASGDEHAFAELHRRYDKKILNYIYRMTGDRERSEDLVQEAFVRVYRHAHRFDGRRRFANWLYVIAGNLAKNELRYRAKRPEWTVAALSAETDGERDANWPLEVEDPASRPDELLRRRVLRETVEEAVQQLSERRRVVFVLRELQGRTYKDIAEITELSEGTVKSRLHRARADFAKIVGPALGLGGKPAPNFWLAT